MYCDQDLDGGTVGGYGPQVVDTVYTLAKALDSSRASDDRKDPDKIYEAIAGVGSGGGFESFSGTVALDNVNGTPGQNGDQKPAARDEPDVGASPCR